MPTDQLFIDPSINNPIAQVNQDTILKAAQLSNIPGISLPTISSALTQLTLPNQAIRNSYISTFTPIATTINMTTPTTTTTTSTTTQSLTIQTTTSTTSKYVTISPGPRKITRRRPLRSTRPKLRNYTQNEHMEHIHFRSDTDRIISHGSLTNFVLVITKDGKIIQMAKT